MVKQSKQQWFSDNVIEVTWVMQEGMAMDGSQSYNERTNCFAAFCPVLTYINSVIKSPQSSNLMNDTISGGHPPAKEEWQYVKSRATTKTPIAARFFAPYWTKFIVLYQVFNRPIRSKIQFPAVIHLQGRKWQCIQSKATTKAQITIQFFPRINLHL